MSFVIKAKKIRKHFYLFDKDFKMIFWLFTKKGNKSIKKSLDEITFSVSHGEIVGVIGRNGAGKSTLMKIVAGITFPTDGCLEVNGKVGSLINLNAGFNPAYTGRENIYYKAKLLDYSNSFIDSIIDDIIEFAELEDYFDLPLKTYSSGMKARLGFSLAIFTNPDILIIDEVFAVGDKKFKEKSKKKVMELFNSGKSVLFASHSESLIREFCTKAIYIDQGKIVYDGDVEEAIKRYNSDVCR